MHHVIRMLVYAPTREAALEKAKRVFNERLIPQFDYGVFFDEEDDMNGTTRWGKLPPVERAESKEGKKIIDDVFKIIKREFGENMKVIREMLNKFNDDELFEGKILDPNKEILKELEDKGDFGIAEPYWFKHQCRKISKGDWLFDNDGEQIGNTDDLKKVLNKEYCEKEDRVWVVPVDVHT